MNIVFDNIIFSKEKQGGISNYWFEIIRGYANSEKAFFYEEKKATDNIFRKNVKINNIIQHYQLPLPMARLLPIGYQSNTDSILYHSSFYRRLITNTNVFEITTIHDFLHNKHSTPLKKTIHNKIKYASIKRASGIICVSNYTLTDLKKYCPAKKTQKVAVIYNGVSNDYTPLKKDENTSIKFLKELNSSEKFLLFVGARSNYKNFDFVVSLLDQLADYKLVIVGNELSGKERQKINKNLLDRIVVAESISNKDLNILYNHAHALIYPSSYEGFGIPIIEAMRAGCPVLALRVTAIPEVSGDAAILFDRLCINEFTKEINLLENNDRRMHLQSLGVENSKRFDWAKCSRETSEFYNEVCCSGN